MVRHLTLIQLGTPVRRYANPIVVPPQVAIIGAGTSVASSRFCLGRAGVIHSDPAAVADL